MEKKKNKEFIPDELNEGMAEEEEKPAKKAKKALV